MPVAVKYTLEWLGRTAYKIKRRVSNILQINIRHEFEVFIPVIGLDADSVHLFGRIN